MIGVDRESFFDGFFSPSVNSLEYYIEECMENDTCRLWGWNDDGELNRIEEEKKKSLFNDSSSKRFGDDLMTMRDNFVNQLTTFSVDWFPEFVCDELEYYTGRFINIYASFTKKLGELNMCANGENEVETFIKIMKLLRRWSLYPQIVREWVNKTYSPLYILTEFPSDMFDKSSLVKYEDEDEHMMIKFIKKIEDMETPDACTNFYSYSYNITHNVIVVINTCLLHIATAA